MALLEFANGAIGTLQATTSVYPGYPRRLELTGAEGTIIIEQDRLAAADLRTPSPDLQRGTEADGNMSASSPDGGEFLSHAAMGV